MPARSLRQKIFKKILVSLHCYRQQALIDATHAVINGASLTITSIGRFLPGYASVKHTIKCVDRLLGNQHLHDKMDCIFQKITQHITHNMSRVISPDRLEWLSLC